MKNKEKALLIADLKKISDSDKYENPFKLEVYERCIQMAEWKEQQMIEKTINWLDSIMYYVSENDNRLVCNFTNFDELINDYKQVINEE